MRETSPMVDLLIKIYELMTVVLPVAALYVGQNILGKNGRKNNSRQYFITLCILTLYVFAVFHFTGTGTVYDIFRNTTKQWYTGKLNLLPFANGISMRPSLLNILLFVPLGFLLPLLWPNTGKLWRVFLFGFCLSLLIELSQYYSYRTTDVEDLIMNTVGTVVGYLMYKLFARVTKWKSKRQEYPKYEPFVYIGVMFFSHFLLYNSVGLRTVLMNF